MSETSAFSSRLKAVAKLGQQVWVDSLSHELIFSGALAAWITDDRLWGTIENSIQLVTTSCAKD